MKRIVLIGCAALSVAGGGTALGAAKMDGSHLHQMTLEYRTPHLDWGFGGTRAVTRLRVLFIVPRDSAREVAELVQRLPVTFEAVVAYDTRQLGIDNIYEAMVDGTSPYAKGQELLKRLETDYDAVVLGNVDFRALPSAAQYRILTLVRNGAGLLLFHGASGKRLPYSKLYAQARDTADFFAGFSCAPASPEPELAAWRFGKGTLVHIPYRDAALPVKMALTPAFPVTRAWQANYENAMVLVMRALLWAAPADPLAVRFACPDLAKSPTLPASGADVPVALSGPGADRARLAYRIRDAYNRVVAEGLSKARDGHRVRVPALSGGRYFCDLMVQQGGHTVNAGLYAFTVASACGDVRVAAPDTVFDRAPIDARFTLEKPSPEPCRLRVKLLDSPKHQTWHQQELDVPANAREVAFRLEGYALPSIAGYLVCELSDAQGRGLAQAEQVLYFPDYSIPAYINFAWESLQEGMGPLLAPQTIETLGWNIALSHPVKDTGYPRAATMLNQRSVVYSTRIGLGKGAKGEAKQYSWFFLGKEDLGAAKALGDDHCFYRPEVQALWRSGLRQRISGLPRHSPVIYSLGDENHFDVEAGFGPHDLKYFRDFVARQYGSVEALNREWDSAYKDFSEVPHLTLHEALALTNYPAWFDHRQYMEQMYADTHHFCRDVIRECDPRAVVGAEGSVPGDMELTMGKLDFWGPYSNLVEDEVLRSLGADKLRTHWWGGLTRGNAVLYPQQLNHALKGSVKGSAWYTATCSSVHSAFAVDYALPDYVKGYLPSMDMLRFGVGQLLIANPLHDSGVRFFWSHPSNAAKLLDPRFIGPGDGLSTLIQASYSEGVGFEFVSERTLERLADPKVKILFLSGLGALSDAAAQAIVAFVNRGGTAVADLNCGLLNEHLRVRTENPLRDLFGNVVRAGLPEPGLAPVAITTEFNGQPLAFAAAKALTTPGSGCFQVRKVGRGQAVLLNFGWSSAVNTADAATPVTRFFTGLLRGAGVELPYGVEAAPAGTMVRLRQGKDFSLLGVRIPDREVAAKPACRVALPGKAYVYRCDTGYVGRTDRLKGDFDGTPFNLFALFSEKQQAPQVGLPEAVARGGAARLDLSGVPDGRIVRVTLCAPDGSPLTARHQVVNRADTQACLLRFAYDDPAGTYEVRITDVATGLSSRKSLRVQ